MATNDSRIGSSTQPPSNLGGSGESLILVRISPTIEREFKRRDVFVELRIERAASILSGATGVHRVCIARAREVLSDARVQRGNPELPRGIPRAYGALASNVEDCIKREERRGLFDDPGMDVARQRMAESPARLEVGERVLCFDDQSEYGSEVEVVDAYRLYVVGHAQGAFVRDDDKRIDYQYGYIVREGDRRFFVEPHRLTREDCKPSHLRLVVSGHAR